MTEQEKKEKLASLEKEWSDLMKKKKVYQFRINGINERIKEVLNEINSL